MQPHYQQREELAKYYLEQHARWGGKKVSLKQFESEISILWATQRLSIMWFGLRHALDGRVDWTDNSDEGRRFFQKQLYEELNALLITFLSSNMT